MIENTKYGFKWDEVLVERIACQTDKRPKFWVLKITAPNEEIVEITMRPLSTEVEIFPHRSDPPTVSGVKDE